MDKGVSMAAPDIVARRESIANFGFDIGSTDQIDLQMRAAHVRLKFAAHRTCIVRS
jgi:hypothetical protein